MEAPGPPRLFRVFLSAYCLEARSPGRFSGFSHQPVGVVEIRYSHLGQSRHFVGLPMTSGLPPETDIYRPAPVGPFRANRRHTIVGTKKKEAANQAANLRKKIFSGQAEDRYDRN